MKQLLAAALVLLTGTVSAIEIGGEDAVKYRQAGLRVMGAHMKEMGAMASDKTPFKAAAFAEGAEAIALMSKLVVQGFGPGTEGGKAKSDIWQDKAKFNRGFETLGAESNKLLAAAKTGDQGAIKAAFGGVGKTCKACHDSFRKD